MSCSCGTKTSTAMTTTRANQPKQLKTQASSSIQSATSGASCSCGGCQPSPWKVSCDTQNRLADCLKGVLCELLRCIEQDMCVDGRLNLGENVGKNLVGCVEHALCEAVHCLPDALCPPAPAPAPTDPLACNFAVEVSK